MPAKHPLQQSFEEVVDHVAHESVNAQGRRMTVGEIAAKTGQRENYLAKATSKNYEEQRLPGDLIVPVTLATKNFAIVDWICAQVGGVFFQLPEVDPANVDVIEQSGRTASEFGDVMRSAAVSLADGKVTVDEARDFRQQVNELVATALQFADLLDVKAGLPKAAAQRVTEGDL